MKICEWVTLTKTSLHGIFEVATDVATKIATKGGGFVMKFVNVRELKNNTSAILHSTENGEDIVVTLRGKPCVVIHHILEDELEEYILLNHPVFKKKLKRAYKEYLSGKTVGLDRLIKKAKKDIGKI